MIHSLNLRFHLNNPLVIFRWVCWLPGVLILLIFLSIFSVNLLPHGLHPLNSHCCHFFLAHNLQSLLLRQKVVFSAGVHVKGGTPMLLVDMFIVQSTQLVGLNVHFLLKSRLGAESGRDEALRTVVFREGHWERFVYWNWVFEQVHRDLRLHGF